MRESIRTGFSFGSTSGIITTLGLMVGLHSGTHSRLAVIGGILTIAIADAFSDALGIHVSEEAEDKHSPLEIWESTIFTFIAKFVVAASFLIPLLLLDFSIAVLACVVYGLFLLGLSSFIMARSQKTNPWMVVGEHIFIALLVVILSHYVGDWIRTIFV
jgi:VIT1/CCC1 family predicted Fe2+/Mn2+ transporter